MEIQFQTYNINFSGRTIHPVIPKAELKHYIDLGYTYNKIAVMYKIPIASVYKSMKIHGFKSQKTMQREENIENINRMLKQGQKKSKIMNELGVSEKTVEKVMEKRKDSTLEEVIKKLNIPPEEIKKYLK